MRTRPLVGGKAWFGPRRLGWGLSPVSPEGWGVTVAAIAAFVCIAVLTRHKWWIGLAVIAVLLIIVFLKGTSPGGAREWEEYQAQKDRRDT
jgi:hypothetical protein